MKTVRQVLAGKGSSVESIAPAASVFDALRKMADKQIGALMVLEGDRILGLISERDYAREIILKGRASRDTAVRDIMATEVVCVEPDQSVEACMALMTEKRVRYLAALEQGRLAGIVSIGDVVKAVIEEQQFTIDQLTHYILGGGRR